MVGCGSCVGRCIVGWYAAKNVVGVAVEECGAKVFGEEMDQVDGRIHPF